MSEQKEHILLARAWDLQARWRLHRNWPRSAHTERGIALEKLTESEKGSEENRRFHVKRVEVERR